MLGAGCIRVVVVDDSAFNRRTIVRILEEIPGVEVVGYAANGEEALRRVIDLKPDLLTLDLEMPRMDGFTFLRLVMQNHPLPIIVVSARSGDDNVFKALELGALDFVAKPSDRVTPELEAIRSDLVKKVLSLPGVRVSVPSVSLRAKPQAAPAAAPRSVATRGGREGFRQIVIGSSTGGPPALQILLSAFREPLPVGIAISQHMPPGFTAAFAARLNRFCSMEVSEARSGDLMEPGRVLIAPGGKNLIFHTGLRGVEVEVVPPDPGTAYVPSVDAMFRSAASVFGRQLLGVVLTGMGRDGSAGVVDIKGAGGTVLAESEDSSVIFGMPKEAIATGKVDQILHVREMGIEISRLCGGAL